MSVFNRIYAKGLDRLKRLENIKRKSDSLKDPNCTFAPVTNHTTSSGKGRQSRQVYQKHRPPNVVPGVEDVLEAILQSVEASSSGAISSALYSQVMNDIISSMNEQPGEEPAALSSDKGSRSQTSSFILQI